MDLFFIYEFAEFPLYPIFYLLLPWLENIIDLNLDIINAAGIFEILILVKDFSYFIKNHAFMLFHHLGIFKVFTYQFLNEIT
jgi:hypothetical protein